MVESEADPVNNSQQPDTISYFKKKQTKENIIQTNIFTRLYSVTASVPGISHTLSQREKKPAVWKSYQL